MPPNASRVSQAVAGFPAGSATLQNLFTAIFDPSASREAVIEAVEFEPAILISLLPIEGVARLEDWHRELTPKLIKDLAFDVALSVELDESNMILEAHREAILAGEIATRIEGARPKETRLAALIARAAAINLQPPHALSTLPPMIVDAARYRDEPANRLAGAPPMIRIVNAAARLAAEANPSEELLAHIGDVVELDPLKLEEARSAANWQYEQLARKLDFTPLDRDAAVRAAMLFRSLSVDADGLPVERKLQVIATHFLDATSLLFFTRDNAELTATLEGEIVSISIQDTSSAIAGSYSRSLIERLPNDASNFIERQLGDRFSTSRPTAIPIANHGVAVVMLPGDRETPQILLSAFGEAAAQLLAQPRAETIELDDIQHQAKEIIHEVSNPLAIVQNYLRTLSIKLGDDHPARSDIDAISRELVRATTLIQRFRHLGGDEPILLSETDINLLLTDTANLIAEGNDATRIDFRLDMTIPRLSLPGDALRQIFMNLLKNAQEALSETLEPCITITSQGAVNVGGRHFMEVEISDNGPGMSPGERLAVFESGMSTKGEGRGLGLGIVSRLVEDINGVISCRDNNTGNATGAGGTTFQLLIPFDFQETNKNNEL